MNILILSWRGPGHPYAGGAERATYEHAKAWAVNGHNVFLFTSSFKGAVAEEMIGGINIVRRGRDVFEVQIRAFFWYNFGKHPKFDLVVDEFHGIPFFTPLYVRKKIFGWIHEVAQKVWKLNPWAKPFNLIPWIIGSFFEPLVFKIFYKNTPFLTVSNSTKKDLIKWGIKKENIVIVENGISFRGISRFKKEKSPTLIYLGALSRDKGIEDAIKAFSLIHETVPGSKFWVVGKGDQEMTKFLISKVWKLKLGKKVKFWGFVSEEKKFELLAKAHVLINPSVHEGWGLVNIEANSVGTPVVGYDVSGMRDSVINGKTGILVEEGNINQMAKETISLFIYKQKYQELRENAIVWSKNFSWEKATKRSLQIITKKA